MTSRSTSVTSTARGDIRKHVLWLRQEADAETATRFARQVIASFHNLAETPGMGARVHSTNPALSSLRKWRIEGFPRFLIFYRPTETGIEVIRLLHGSQDWWALLDVN